MEAVEIARAFAAKSSFPLGRFPPLPQPVRLLILYYQALSTLARKFGDVFGGVKRPLPASRRVLSTSIVVWQDLGG